MSMLPLLFSAHAAVVVNELLPDPAGADGGHEWIELYNDGSGPVDLTGWSIEAGTSSFSVRHTFGSLQLPPGAWLLVGEEHVVDAEVMLPPGVRLALGNAASSGDAVRLVDAGGVPIDTVVYGPDNADGFVDDTGSIAAASSPAPGSGRSLRRVPDGADTDGADLSITADPTPGTSNVTGPACDPADGSVRINEFLPDPDGPDAGAEWVELVATGGTVDLSGWRLEAGTRGFDTVSVLPLGLVLVSGGLVVVGTTDHPVIDIVAPGFRLGNATTADGVRLVDCLGNVADTVIYGDGGDDGWLDDLGAPAAGAPSPVSGASLARVPSGHDTDDSSVDFVLGPPSPSRLEAITPSCGGPGSGVVINEFLPDPYGPDAGFEWVELFHGGDVPVELEDWTLQAATGPHWSDRRRFASERLHPGDRLLIGGDEVPGVTHALDGPLGNGSGGDGVRLIDCAGEPVDTVVYGSENADDLTDEAGLVASELAPLPRAGTALQRREDGLDTDHASVDLVLTDAPSPGAPNRPVPVVHCTPDPGGVVINEVLPDPEGTDAGREWIELYNPTGRPITLDGWGIAAGTSDYRVHDVVFPAGTSIDAGAFLVIGGPAVPDADHVVVDLSIGNGTTSRDGVRLIDCQGTPVDTVVYGFPGAEDPDPGIVDDHDTVGPSSGEPVDGLALLRIADGVDTDHPLDWRVGIPSPGASNVPPPTTGEPDAVPTGCGGSAPSSTRPPPADTTAPTPGCMSTGRVLGGAWLLTTLVLARRRRGAG